MIETVFFNRSESESGETSWEKLMNFSPEEKSTIYDIAILGTELDFDFKDFKNLIQMELFITDRIKFLDISDLKKVESLLIRKSPSLIKIVISPLQFANTHINLVNNHEYDINGVKLSFLENYYKKNKIDRSFDEYKKLQKSFVQYKSAKEKLEQLWMKFINQNGKI